MNTTYLQLPQTSIIDLLKSLPREQIINIFDTLMVFYDDSPLTKSEKQKIANSINEMDNKELVDWESIK